ncbi:hypothetical protein M2140_000101 [Clostridiales Family XIII bacterium PM5-7]
MELIDKYWTDSRGNQWSQSLYSKEEAEKWSLSLVDCDGCIDCKNCTGCGFCNRCSDCERCMHCKNCIGCVRCHSCDACEYCSHCHVCVDCSDCENCERCINCEECLDCISCQDCECYVKQPRLYITGKIGIYDDIAKFYYGQIKNGQSLQIICGDFRGSLAEFEDTIQETHGDNHYAQQYKAEIEKVKVLFELSEEPELPIIYVVKMEEYVCQLEQEEQNAVLRVLFENWASAEEMKDGMSGKLTDLEMVCKFELKG